MTTEEKIDTNGKKLDKLVSNNPNIVDTPRIKTLPTNIQYVLISVTTKDNECLLLGFPKNGKYIYEYDEIEDMYYIYDRMECVINDNTKTLKYRRNGGDIILFITDKNMWEYVPVRNKDTWEEKPLNDLNKLLSCCIVQKYILGIKKTDNHDNNQAQFCLYDITGLEYVEIKHLVDFDIHCDAKLVYIGDDKILSIYKSKFIEFKINISKSKTEIYATSFNKEIYVFDELNDFDIINFDDTCTIIFCDTGKIYIYDKLYKEWYAGHKKIFKNVKNIRVADTEKYIHVSGYHQNENQQIPYYSKARLSVTVYAILPTRLYIPYKLESFNRKVKNPVIILIGNSDYPKKEDCLPGVEFDIKKMKHLFIDVYNYDARYLFEEENVCCEKLFHCLRTFAQKINKFSEKDETIDGIIFYYSGHGYKQHLALKDGHFSIAAINDYIFNNVTLKNIPRLYFYDCCRGSKDENEEYSKSIRAKSIAFDSITQKRHILNTRSKNTNICFFHSSSPGYVSYLKKNGECSAWTDCLVYILEKNANEYIPLNKLIAMVNENLMLKYKLQVPSMVNQLHYCVHLVPSDSQPCIKSRKSIENIDSRNYIGRDSISLGLNPFLNNRRNSVRSYSSRRSSTVLDFEPLNIKDCVDTSNINSTNNNLKSSSSVSRRSSFTNSQIGSQNLDNINYSNQYTTSDNSKTSIKSREFNNDENQQYKL